MHFTAAFLFILFFATVGLRDVKAGTAECGTNPIDIHFVLDASGSILPDNFQIMLNFVKNFINQLEVATDKVQFAVTTYATEALNQFWLNTYTTKANLQAAISAISYSRGASRTDKALDFVREKAFTTAHGDRADAMNVVIVITDGQSTEPAFTTAAANLIRQSNIAVLAVGVGNGYNKAELREIASDASRVFHVENWDALKYIQDELQSKACEEEDDTVIEPTDECGINPVDIHFLLDASGSILPENFQTMLNFVKNYTNPFEIGADKTQFGVTTFATEVQNQFWLNSYNTKANLQAAISAIIQAKGGTRTDRGLDFVREQAFTTARGDRAGVRNVLIVITDGKSDEPILTADAADLIHQSNITVLAVGIGNDYNLAELEVIATDASRVFQVANWDALEYILEVLQSKACEVCALWSDTNAMIIDDKCVRLFTTPKQWQQAKDACAAEGPGVTLLEISSETILQHVQTEVKASGTRTWLGASDAAQEGTWIWVNSGNTLNVTSPWWGTNQPDNAGGHENCLIMRPDQKLNDYPCGSGLPYFCELSGP